MGDQSSQTLVYLEDDSQNFSIGWFLGSMLICHGEYNLGWSKYFNHQLPRAIDQFHADSNLPWDFGKKMLHECVVSQHTPLKTNNVPWKSMVGRCIPYWNSNFLGDILVFRGVTTYNNIMFRRPSIPFDMGPPFCMGHIRSFSPEVSV